MSDPAVEAAQRAYGAMGAEATIWDEAVTASREALKPIREWFDRNYGMSSITDYLLDDLTPLIFTTEELNQ